MFATLRSRLAAALETNVRAFVPAVAGPVLPGGREDAATIRLAPPALGAPFAWSAGAERAAASASRTDTAPATAGRPPRAVLAALGAGLRRAGVATLGALAPGLGGRVVVRLFVTPPRFPRPRREAAILESAARFDI